MAAPTKIVRLTAENVKRLRAVEIRPDGAVVQIRGKNSQGKSSVLDAIWMALGGRRAFPRRPVREGAEEGRVELELEDLVVTRRIKPDGQTSLTVASKDGARYPSPQAMLDDLVGALSFDPLAFARMKPAEQRELLRKLVGLDTSPIEAERAQLYDERTIVNREVKRLEGEVSGVPHHADAPTEELSVAELGAELQRAEEHQREIDRAETAVEHAAAALGEARDHAERIAEEIERLEAQLEQLRQRLEEGTTKVIPEREQRLTQERERLDALRQSAPDRDAIRERLASAEQLNQQIRDNRRREALKTQHAEQARKSEELSKAIAALDAKKASVLASVTYPLEGLALDEQGVLLNGLPLEQASSAEQLRASVAIGLALNPQLRVLLVRDGSLLDEDSLRLLSDMAADAEAQVWLEVVGEGDVGIVIEDGAVKGAAEAAQ